MELWLVIVIVAVVVVAVIAALAVRASRRRREVIELQDRFGPEYDRTMENADGRRDQKDARADLADRAERRDQLDIRDLSDGARDRYSEAWTDVQTRFVDEPQAAVLEADGLIAQVMRERGYPVDQFDEQADMVSVDHPHVVENYRAGHAVYQQAKRGEADTEELRQAFVHYRSLFDELLDASHTTQQ